MKKSSRKLCAWIALAGSIGLAGCKGDDKPLGGASTTTASPSTSGQIGADELAADLPLIKAFFRTQSDSWADPAGDHESAFAWLLAHDYPEIGVTEEQCRDFLGDRATTPEYIEEWVLDESSVERDDGWVMPFQPLKGQVPKGRIYIAKVTRTINGYGAPEVSTNELHVTIRDGKPYGFIVC